MRGRARPPLPALPGMAETTQLCVSGELSPSQPHGPGGHGSLLLPRGLSALGGGSEDREDTEATSHPGVGRLAAAACKAHWPLSLPRAAAAGHPDAAAVSPHSAPRNQPCPPRIPGCTSGRAGRSLWVPARCQPATPSPAGQAGLWEFPTQGLGSCPQKLGLPQTSRTSSQIRLWMDQRPVYPR